MTNNDTTELSAGVTRLRNETFDLIERINAAGWADRRMPAAAAQLQSAANRLGAVESMLSFEHRTAA